MSELRSEHISKRMFSAMFIVLLSLLLISVPLLIRSYQDYQKNQQAQIELGCLNILADFANDVSKERAPANKAMSASPVERERYIKELQQYRIKLDQKLIYTISHLQQSGFNRVAYYLETEFKRSLSQGRKAVDHYIDLLPDQRSLEEMDKAIVSMFAAWDSVHLALQRVVNQSYGKETAVSNYYTLILLLAELRDQAGRSGSNVVASIGFNQPVSANNVGRFLQTKRQTWYLWELIGVILPEHQKTAEFTELHLQLKRQYLDQSIPMIEHLIDEGMQGKPYSMTVQTLTDALVKNFTTVIDLQSFMLEHSLKEAEQETHAAEQRLIISFILTLVALLVLIFASYYLNRYIFLPLIQARDLLFGLSQTPIEKQLQVKSPSLFSAIRRVEDMLMQRDRMEFQLKNLANTDPLTGISNRFALDEYLKLLEMNPLSFQRTCLIMLDIDHFKTVNDQHGHLLGDQVIQWVADNLKNHVRASDIVVRYGGDEFMVVIENIDLSYALNVAEKIRKEISSARFLDEHDVAIPISISAGVAVGADSWLTLFQQADQALFRAKNAGRNTVSS